MDTDRLSEEAYTATIREAAAFHHDLPRQFGLLAGHCSDEPEYLDNCKGLIKEFKKKSHAEISDIFFDDIPKLSEFRKALDRILANIAEVAKIPIEKRHFESDEDDDNEWGSEEE